MLNQNVCAEDVSKFLNIHISTVYSYFKSYSTAGLSEFLATGYDGFWGNLSSVEIRVLRSELKRTVYTDARSVASWINYRFGVKYTPQGAVDLLNRIGFTYKKTGEVPCECNIEAQQQFVSEMSEILKIRLKRQ
jgi:transposase